VLIGSATLPAIASTLPNSQTRSQALAVRSRTSWMLPKPVFCFVRCQHTSASKCARCSDLSTNSEEVDSCIGWTCQGCCRLLIMSTNAPSRITGLFPLPKTPPKTPQNVHSRPHLVVVGICSHDDQTPDVPTRDAFSISEDQWGWTVGGGWNGLSLHIGR